MLLETLFYLKNSTELKSQSEVFQIAHLDYILVASIRNDMIEIGAAEVAKKDSPLKTNTDAEKLVQIMSTKIQVLFSWVNDDFTIVRKLGVVEIQHVSFLIPAFLISAETLTVFV